MKVIAFDPGTNIGWAIMENTQPIEFGEIRYGEELFEFLAHSYELFDTCIIENYRIRPPNIQKGREKKFTHPWSNVTPAKAIGAIEFYASRLGIPVVLQEPSILPVGFKLIRYQKSSPNTHPPDYISAMAHAAYWFHKNGYYKEA